MCKSASYNCYKVIRGTICFIKGCNRGYDRGRNVTLIKNMMALENRTIGNRQV